jgi:glycosyltransferase involved in cell wall biosynthesis
MNPPAHAIVTRDCDGGIVMTDGPHCVALSTPAWPRGASPNGIVTYTAELAAALRETGVRPVILSWHVEPSLDESGRASSSGDVVDICDFEPPRTLLRRLLEKASRTLGRNAHLATRFQMIKQAIRVAVKRYPIEVLEIEEARGIALPVIEARLLPVVVRLHGPWFLNGQALGVKEDAEFERRDKLEREAIARADVVTAPSRDVLERTRAHYGLALEHAEVVYPPVESRRSGPFWDLADCDRNRVVFIGRFDRHKGGDLMIEAFSRIARTRPQLTLDFVGPDRGVLDDAGRTIPLNEYLTVHVPDTNLRSRIVVHGQQPSATIAGLRRRGFLTVVPSRYETFGYTAVEALTLGCPVIAANAGGLAETVRDKETGLLFDAGDARSLADKMAMLLDSPQLAAQLGEAGRKDVASRYAPRSIAEQTLATYASVLNRRRGRSCGAERPKANA